MAAPRRYVLSPAGNALVDSAFGSLLPGESSAFKHRPALDQSEAALLLRLVGSADIPAALLDKLRRMAEPS